MRQPIVQQQKPGLFSQLAMAYLGGEIGSALTGGESLGFSDFLKNNTKSIVTSALTGNQFNANTTPMGQNNTETNPAKGGYDPTNGMYNPNYNLMPNNTFNWNNGLNYQNPWGKRMTTWVKPFNS